MEFCLKPSINLVSCFFSTEIALESVFYPVFSSERVNTVPVKGRIIKDTTTENPEW
jgi:hypothetical protein